MFEIQIFNKMITKKEDNIRSESYYPDSNYYLDHDNTPKETPLSEQQISIGLLRKGLMVGLQ